MADTEKPSRKKVILTIVGVIVVLIVAAGAGFALRIAQNKNNDTGVATGAKLPQTVSDAQDLRLQGKSDEADKKIDAALNDSKTSNDDKYLLYLEKGAGQTDKNDYTAAADAYAKAAAIKETSNVYDNLGDSYAAAGQKDKAVEAYKKAITLVGGPVAEDDKAALENKIRNLGGSL